MMGGALVAGVAGNYAGAKVGQMMANSLNGGSGNGVNPILSGTSSANKILQRALNSALNYSQLQTNAAVGTENSFLNTATGDLTSYLNNATNTATGNMNQGLLNSEATLYPVVQTGYSALDQYLDTLGVARPAEGMGAFSTQLQQQSALQPYISSLQSAYNAYQQAAGTSGGNMFNINSAPTAPTIRTLAQTTPLITNQQIYNDLLQNNKISQYETYNQFLNGSVSNSPYYVTAGSAAANQAQQQLAQQLINQDQTNLNTFNQNVMNPYNTYQTAYNALQTQLNGMTTQGVQAALAGGSGLFGTPQVV